MKSIKSVLLIATSFFFMKGGIGQDTSWVKTNTWYFDNFVRDTLPWSLFREAFIGVAPAPSGDFDQLFYDNLYKTKLASTGHCFGMDVLALLIKKNGGYMGYCYPVYQFSGKIFFNTSPTGVPSNDTIGPADKDLETLIAILHGNQINHGFLSYLLDVIAIGKNRNGNYAFDQVNHFLAKDDPPIISITKGLSPADGGHVLIPYFTEVVGSTKRIYVYDPNYSFYRQGTDGHDFYTSGSNYIEINTTGNSWKYNMARPSATVDFWSGDPSSGGNCIVIPLSIAGKKDRLPQSLLAEAAYTLNTIFIFGNVEIEQISNPLLGLHYYGEDGHSIENDPGTRLNTIMPFIPMVAEPSTNEKDECNAFFFKGAEPLEILYSATGDFRIEVLFNGTYHEINGTGKKGTERITTGIY
jgi:hypothetical protein